MRPTKLSTLACAAAAAAALSLAACGSSGTSSGSSAHPTLTYWASNQGTSLQDDQQVLAPQIAKFTKQTGIKVKVQVIPWTTLLNQITAATVSGKGPDVLNIGNTWSASLQATGAFLPFTHVGHEHRSAAPAGSWPAACRPPARPASRRWPSRSTARPTACTTTRPSSRRRASAGRPRPGSAVRRGRQEADQGRALRADPRGGPDPGERPPGVRAEPAAGRVVLQLRGQAHVRHPAERGRGQADDRLHADRQDRQSERRAVLQGHRGAHRLRHREGGHGLLADGLRVAGQAGHEGLGHRRRAAAAARPRCRPAASPSPAWWRASTSRSSRTARTCPPPRSS